MSEDTTLREEIEGMIRRMEEADTEEVEAILGDILGAYQLEAYQRPPPPEIYTREPPSGAVSVEPAPGGTDPAASLKALAKRIPSGSMRKLEAAIKDIPHIKVIPIGSGLTLVLQTKSQDLEVSLLADGSWSMREAAPTRVDVPEPAPEPKPAEEEPPPPVEQEPEEKPKADDVYNVIVTGRAIPNIEDGLVQYDSGYLSSRDYRKPLRELFSKIGLSPSFPGYMDGPFARGETDFTWEVNGRNNAMGFAKALTKVIPPTPTVGPYFGNIQVVKCKWHGEPADKHGGTNYWAYDEDLPNNGVIWEH